MGRHAGRISPPSAFVLSLNYFFLHELGEVGPLLRAYRNTMHGFFSHRVFAQILLPLPFLLNSHCARSPSTLAHDKQEKRVFVAAVVAPAAEQTVISPQKHISCFLLIPSSSSRSRSRRKCLHHLPPEQVPLSFQPLGSCPCALANPTEYV